MSYMLSKAQLDNQVCKLKTAKILTKCPLRDSQSHVAVKALINLSPKITHTTNQVKVSYSVRTDQIEENLISTPTLLDVKLLTKLKIWTFISYLWDNFLMLNTCV